MTFVLLFSTTELITFILLSHSPTHPFVTNPFRSKTFFAAHSFNQIRMLVNAIKKMHRLPADTSIECVYSDGKQELKNIKKSDKTSGGDINGNSAAWYFNSHDNKDKRLRSNTKAPIVKVLVIIQSKHGEANLHRKYTNIAKKRSRNGLDDKRAQNSNPPQAIYPWELGFDVLDMLRQWKQTGECFEAPRHVLDDYFFIYATLMDLKTEKVGDGETVRSPNIFVVSNDMLRDHQSAKLFKGEGSHVCTVCDCCVHLL